MAAMSEQYSLINRVGIVGAGIMGIGIAETMAAAGLTVHIFDQFPGKAEASKQELAKRLDSRVSRGKLDSDTAAGVLDRITPVDALGDLAEANLVIEAVVEDIGVKRELIAALEKCLPPEAIIATNTSSLSVTAIAGKAQNPQRIAGFHFFNPVPLMRVVEVIKAALTDARVIDVLKELAVRVGHRPVMASDTPGFIVNHAGRAYGTEALAMIRENIADFTTIDAILRDAAGFRMGPFELLDLTGLDVSHPVMEAIYGQYYHEPRYRPSVITRQRLDAGLLGRKSGRGFYDYSDDATTAVASDGARNLPKSVTIIGDTPDKALHKIAKQAGVPVINDVSASALVLIGLIGDDLTSAIVREGLNSANTIGFDPLFGIHRHRTLVASPGATELTRQEALALAQSDGVKASLVEDTCGTVCQRVLAMIVNIAADIVHQNIASVDDLDAAVRLGLGYPYGPLEWGDRIGADIVVHILDRMFGRTGDPRYRASLWLRRRAELKLPLAECN
ncbi:3-hydroxyacyl-CoA dehydrogenase [Brucella pseudogrignonensis]|jgi:3-hydroxybutyryl-CoA dehydrogenase|uniref:3-hydroxyacyl-CoA dehydrogenase n=1 Tax=Brucella pseudogrignonensis TaxID=419475 RepID=UPI000CFB58BF|nr:3-hydroxyacyl-CoA dehydrogenase [Brucella pseudogrignonensis]MQP41349.1 3-hydroxyacyl-CoA dehydrogenase [Ochrobactrum sp. MYb237]PQZ40265.1 3-hydroxyacyl-CoA dehydrogenase [Brucella pseudogrignonensis]PRA40242.1 3-hydroxyacyl-CoA dehydrogenase [Brucella pseudogrignonensis]PRA67773.1 3-hydroxyacyl-CoA dehydrogenase [Brucella pseudogrignonensis]